MCIDYCTLQLMIVVQDDAECPSIGELIDLLEAAWTAHETGSEDKTVVEILAELFTLKYLHIQINLAHYLHRQWSPRNWCK